MSGEDFDFDRELKFVATEAVLSRDVDEASQHVRQLATRVARQVAQVGASQRAIDHAYKEFMAMHAEDMLDDPEIMKRVQAREQVLKRAGLAAPERWHRAVNDVRARYGDANSRVIRGIRQQRLAARFAGDTESYDFDMGTDDPNVETVTEAAEEEILKDHQSAIQQMQIARQGGVQHELKIDKARYLEQELRRRQRNDR